MNVILIDYFYYYFQTFSNSSFAKALTLLPLPLSINRYPKVRPGNSRVQQLTPGTRSPSFPAAQLVRSRHSWHMRVILSAFTSAHARLAFTYSFSINTAGRGDTGCRHDFSIRFYINILTILQLPDVVMP